METERDSSPKIMGSAEHLSPEETRKRLQELADWGVDLTLVCASLERTPTERVMRMLDLLNLSKELRRSYIASTSKKIRTH